MSVKAGINVVFKRRLPKYVEYAAISAHPTPKKGSGKNTLFGGFGKT